RRRDPAAVDALEHLHGSRPEAGRVAGDVVHASLSYTPTAMSGLRALVVHGQPEALGELVEILTDYGALASGPQLVVDTARSATEAIHRVSAQEYAVIVSDHRPPELNGLELLERTVFFAPDAMRIVILGNTEAVAEAELKPLGTIFRFFARPWERRQLVRIVAEGLQLPPLQRQQRALLQKTCVPSDNPDKPRQPLHP